MIKCPKCQAEIDNDSCFCDQCGAELFVCPKCGVLGKGKRCTRCGEPLVAVKDLGKAAAASKPVAPSPGTSSAVSPSSPSSPLSSSTSGPVAGGPSASSSITTDIDKLIGNLNHAAPAAGATIRPGAPQPASQQPARQIPGHLVCRNPQLRLYIDEVIIGRREGGYASVFGAFGMVSGRHAQISRIPSGGWQVMDLGSTNGTRLNGTPLTPNVPAPFWVGDNIAFADIVFEAVP